MSDKKFNFKFCVLLPIVLAVTIFLWAVPVSFYGIEALTVVQQRVIALFVFAALMWMFEIIPNWTTSLLLIVLTLLTISDKGISLFCDPKYGTLVSYKSLMASFADPVVMLFMGGFVLAIMAEKYGLDVTLARILLKPFGTRPSMVLLGFLVVIAVFSMFMSNTATAAMMLAFLAPVLRSLPGNSKGKIALAMAIPLGANIGGIATPIGTPPNGVAMKYLNDPGTLDMLREAGQEAHEVTFGQWCTAMIPVTLITLFIGWVVLQIMFPFQKGERIEIKIQGGLRKGYKTWMVAITFALTIILWFTGEWNHLNANVVALVPIC
jgi:sodium-dependent dicarboxylate transporter 2/3/5